MTASNQGQRRPSHASSEVHAASRQDFSEILNMRCQSVACNTRPRSQTPRLAGCHASLPERTGQLYSLELSTDGCGVTGIQPNDIRDQANAFPINHQIQFYSRNTIKTVVMWLFNSLNLNSSKTWSQGFENTSHTMLDAQKQPASMHLK